MNIAKEVASRATCMSAHFGALIVKDDQIISTGYNGAPRGTKDCYEIGDCLRRKMNIPSGTQYEMCRSVHAEQNCIINAARAGVSVFGADMYLFGKRVLDGDKLIKSYPCFICKKMVINSGIKRFIGHDENGDLIEYLTEDWIREWAEKDMIEDNQKYSANYRQASGIKEEAVKTDAPVKSGCCGGDCCG